MEIKELKNKVLKKLTGVKDKNLLEEVYRLLETGNDETDLYILNEDQLKSVTEAKEEVKKGEVLSDEEADKDIEKWVNR